MIDTARRRGLYQLLCQVVDRRGTVPILWRPATKWDSPGSLSSARKNGKRKGVLCAKPRGSGRAILRPRPARKKTAEGGANERPITQNRKARHNYSVLDTLECGIVLVGSEVKSLREGRVSLDEAYARVKDDEVWLVGCDIAEYVEANRFNHNPRRPRKLLMHRREVKRFAHRAYEKGLTLVPLEMHFKRGLAKVVLGICRGKQRHDKREAMKKAEAQRDMQRQMMRRR